MCKPKTGKYSQKPYACSGCGTEKTYGTNHWGQVYHRCFKCGHIIAWNCLEPMPDGYERPENWKIVQLGEIADIRSVR